MTIYVDLVESHAADSITHPQQKKQSIVKQKHDPDKSARGPGEGQSQGHR